MTEGGLAIRVVSALVLAPPVLVALYFGPPYSDVLILLAAGIAAWEWARLCRPRAALDKVGGLAVLAVVAAVAAAVLDHYAIAAWLVAVGAMAAMLLAGRDRHGDALWLAAGVGYLALACMALVWLRDDSAEGRTIVFWLIAVVWATDIAAYVAGRAIGGPKLAPAISPKKTWAGLGGGMAGASAVGLATAALVGSPAYVGWVVPSVALAVAAQVGDLFESSLKRRAGVKDASNLIPGHGGLLDRIDGLLAGVLMTGGIAWLSETLG